MFKKIRNRLKSDRGDSSLVSLIILIPLIVAILITMIDTSIYFSNRAQVLNSARDAARTVAIYGGDGTAKSQTPLERSYGIDRASVCTSALANSVVTKGAYKPDTSTAIECSLMKTINESKGLIQTTLSNVNCGPGYAQQISDRVYCEVTWKYEGVPGSGLTLIRSVPDGALGSGDPGLAGSMITVGNSQTEVGYGVNSPYVPR